MQSLQRNETLQCRTPQGISETYNFDIRSDGSYSLSGYSQQFNNHFIAARNINSETWTNGQTFTQNGQTIHQFNFRAQMFAYTNQYDSSTAILGGQTNFTVQLDKLWRTKSVNIKGAMVNPAAGSSTIVEYTCTK